VGTLMISVAGRKKEVRLVNTEVRAISKIVRKLISLMDARRR